jgi:threonine/homoserine/homoserine lactone efflux protein
MLIHFLACFTPGPALLYALDVLYKINLKSSMKVVIGIVVGNTIEIILSLSGVSILGTIGKKYPKYFYTACALLLLMLGFKSIFGLINKKKQDSEKDLSKRFVLTGVLITFLNPKALIFWALMLYPVVLDYTIVQKIFTGLYFVVATFVFISCVVLIASILKDKTTRFLKFTQGIFGFLMILFAILLVYRVFSM